MLRFVAVPLTSPVAWWAWLPRIIQQMSRNLWSSDSLSIKWKTLGGNRQVDLLAQLTQNRRGRGGWWGHVSWGLEEAGNSPSWNFSYRAVWLPSPLTSTTTLLPHTLLVGGWERGRTSTWPQPFSPHSVGQPSSLWEVGLVTPPP